MRAQDTVNQAFAAYMQNQDARIAELTEALREIAESGLSKFRDHGDMAYSFQRIARKALDTP